MTVGPTRRAPRLILVADDSAEVREYFRDVLSGAGYAVLEAADGEEAALLAREHAPDLLLMDVAMPIMDGLEAMELLRLDPATEDLPVVAVSGFALVAAAMRRAGFQTVLSKPVPAWELLRTVHCWLSLAPRGARRYPTSEARREAGDR